jgi:FtsH-binding integral membrane protein
VTQSNNVNSQRTGAARSTTNSDWAHQVWFLLFAAIAIPLALFACLWPLSHVTQHLLLWLSLVVMLTSLFGTFLSSS